MDTSRTARLLDPTRRTPTILFLALLAALPASCSDERAPSSDSEPNPGEVAQAVVTLPPNHAWGLDEASGTTALDSGSPGGGNATLGVKATRITPGRVGAGAGNGSAGT